MTQTIDPQLIKRLENFYRKWCGGTGKRDEPAIRDFAFHMTDWIEDLRALHELFGNPDAVTPEQFNEVVFGFLTHASGHILAASELAEVKPVKFKMPIRRLPAVKRALR